MSETQERVQKEHGVRILNAYLTRLRKKIHQSSWRLKAIYKSLWQTVEVPDTLALQNIYRKSPISARKATQHRGDATTDRTAYECVPPEQATERLVS